jgi:hypothetical protein
LDINTNPAKYQAFAAVGLSLRVFLEYRATSGVIFGQPATKRHEIDDVKQKVNAAGHDRLTVRFGKEEFWNEFIRNANIPHQEVKLVTSTCFKYTMNRVSFLKKYVNELWAK